MPTKAQQAALDKLLNEILAYRAEMQLAEVRYYLFLCQVEIEQKEIWSIGGAKTYDMFLSTHALVSTGKYREFLAGLEIVGEKSAVDLGVAGTIEMRKLRSTEKKVLQEIANRAHSFQEVRGTAPSEQTASGWVRELNRGMPKVVAVSGALRKLRQENADLRKQVRTLEMQLKKKDAEIAKLKASRERSGKKGVKPIARA